MTGKRDGRRLRLHTVTMLTALATAILMAGLTFGVGGAFLRVLDLAEEADRAIVPQITRQHEYAVFAARMGQLAEAVLRSSSPEERAGALAEVEEVSRRFEAAPDILQRLEQAIQAVRRTAERADSIDALAARATGLREKGDEAFLHLLRSGAPLTVQEPFHRALEALAGGLAATDATRLAAQSDRFHRHAAEVVNALIPLEPGARAPLVRAARDLDGLGDLFTLRRTILSEAGLMGLETEIAHGVLNDLSASLTDAAATSTRTGPHDASISSRYCSGRSRPSLRTDRLITCHRTSTSRTRAASSIHRDVIHAHGQAGSNQKSTTGTPGSSRAGSCPSVPVPVRPRTSPQVARRPVGHRGMIVRSRTRDGPCPFPPRPDPRSSPPRGHRR